MTVNVALAEAFCEPPLEVARILCAPGLAPPGTAIWTVAVHVWSSPAEPSGVESNVKVTEPPSARVRAAGRVQVEARP